MYTELATQPRFCLDFENADHLAVVRLENGQWQYNDDTNWVDFQPEATDRLLAQVDFDLDVVRGFEGTLEDGTLRGDLGIAAGYLDGDLHFLADRWAGQADVGEIEVSGSRFSIPSDSPTPATSQDRLERLGLAIFNYESATRSFPAHAIYSDEGFPALSWRVRILPYLGYQSLYEQFRLTETWDSPHNSALLNQMPDVFQSPDRATMTGQTVYQVLNGPDTLFPISADGLSAQDLYSSGPQHTVMLVETDAGESVPWTKPQDVSFDASQPLASRPDESEFHVLFADGEVFEFGASSLDSNSWNVLAVRNSGFVDTSEILPPYEIETSMERITRAILNYESATQRFPRLATPEGARLLSWRVAILPYIGHGDLYSQFDRKAPWDSPQNLALLPQMPRIYASPSVDGPLTTFLGASGEGTAFPLTGRRGPKFSELVDGAETALVVEADPAAAIEWTRPGDLIYTTDGSELPGAGDPAKDEFRVSLADGTILEVPTGTSPENWIASTSNFFDSATHNLEAIANAALNSPRGSNSWPTHAIYSDDGSTPLLSWRVQLLPYLGYHRLYDEFNLNESWDSPHNLALLPQMPRIFAHPQVSGYRTNYLAMSGAGTIFPINSERLPWQNIEDGLSRTLAFVEADADQAVEWTKPDDIVFDIANPLVGVGSIVESGFHVAFADGSARQLPANIAPTEFVAAVLRDDESNPPAGRIMGDVNLDGEVNELDFIVIRDNLFQWPTLFYTWQDGDLNEDHVVDVSDFNLWLANRDAS